MHRESVAHHSLKHKIEAQIHQRRRFVVSPDNIRIDKCRSEPVGRSAHTSSEYIVVTQGLCILGAQSTLPDRQHKQCQKKSHSFQSREYISHILFTIVQKPMRNATAKKVANLRFFSRKTKYLYKNSSQNQSLNQIRKTNI